MDTGPDTRYLPSDAQLIRHKVTRILGRYGYSPSDRLDLEQELAMHVATHMGRYDKGRGTRGAFVDRMVTNKIASIIEHRVRLKRDPRRERPLREDFEPARGDGAQAAEDLRMDMTEALSALEPGLQQLAELLKDQTVADVIRQTGLTRQEVRSRVLRIGRHLKQLGLGCDFKKKRNQPARRRGS